MKTNKKNIAQLTLLALAVVVLSSCNRGTGCPTSFSLQPIFTFLGF